MKIVSDQMMFIDAYFIFTLFRARAHARAYVCVYHEGSLRHSPFNYSAALVHSRRLFHFSARIHFYTFLTIFEMLSILCCSEITSSQLYIYRDALQLTFISYVTTKG